MIGYIFAMEREADALIGSMNILSEEKHAGCYTTFQGRVKGVAASVSICQPGKVNAAMCATRICERYGRGLTHIVNIGVCGATTDELPIGSVIVPHWFVQHDIDTTAVGDERGLVSGLGAVRFYSAKGVSSMEDALMLFGVLAVRRGAVGIATGDQFIGTGDGKRAIFQAFGAHLCDMESAAIAQICASYRMPYRAVKVVSDTPAGCGPLDYGEFMKTAPELIRRIAEITAGHLDHRRGDGRA